MSLSSTFGSTHTTPAVRLRRTHHAVTTVICSKDLHNERCTCTHAHTIEKQSCEGHRVDVVDLGFTVACPQRTSPCGGRHSLNLWRELPSTQTSNTLQCALRIEKQGRTELCLGRDRARNPYEPKRLRGTGWENIHGGKDVPPMPLR